MPRTSQAAIDRRNQNRRDKRAAARAERMKDTMIIKPVLSSHKITARRLMPRLPEMSKADLRAMLATAVQNTGRG
jgi:spore coat protein CotF